MLAHIYTANDPLSQDCSWQQTCSSLGRKSREYVDSCVFGVMREVAAFQVELAGMLCVTLLVNHGVNMLIAYLLCVFKYGPLI